MPGQPQVGYSYDSASRVTSITQGSSLVQFAYDSASRRTMLTLPNGVTTQSGYDSASRLTSLAYKLGTTVLGDLQYSYDAAGNRSQVGGAWARTGLPQPLTGASYNANNQQVAFGGQTLTYDLNGNLTSDGTNTYTWDARNRLAAITGPVPASFVYDATGRRARKAINGTVTDFLYDGVNPTQELSGAGAASLLTGLGIDEHFVRTDTSGASALLTDALGSTVALTDVAGAVQTQYTYEPFGATTVTGPTITSRYDYTGRENDGTGLYYYRARYYSPGLQRFMSEDPLGLAAGDASFYSYAHNNPVIYTDPLGYGAIDRTLDWITPRILRFPRFPVLVFIPVAIVEVIAKGPCIIPKTAVQAAAAYYGSQAGSALGFSFGFAVGEAIVPFGGGLPGGVAGWVVGGTGGSFAAAWSAGVLIDAITPSGACAVPKVEGRSKSSQ